MDQNFSKEVARELLKIKAVKFDLVNKFTWVSGIKSPIYTDNRLITGFVNSRNLIAKKLANLIKTKYKDVEIIIGTATGGIAPALYAAHYLDLPMGYVRSNNKNHGRQKQIEGVAVANKKIVVVEDLFSTGSSVLKVAQVLKQEKGQILGIVSIFNYELKQLVKNLKDFSYYSLTNLTTLLNVAQEEKYLTSQQSEEIKQFKNNL